MPACIVLKGAKKRPIAGHRQSQKPLKMAYRGFKAYIAKWHNNHLLQSWHGLCNLCYLGSKLYSNGLCERGYIWHTIGYITKKHKAKALVLNGLKSGLLIPFWYKRQKAKKWHALCMPPYQN